MEAQGTFTIHGYPRVAEMLPHPDTDAKAGLICRFALAWTKLVGWHVALVCLVVAPLNHQCYLLHASSTPPFNPTDHPHCASARLASSTKAAPPYDALAQLLPAGGVAMPHQPPQFSVCACVQWLSVGLVRAM